VRKPIELSEEFILELTQVQQRLFGFLFKRLADRDQARGVLQRTNLVLCRKADKYELGTNFKAWAMTVANYEVMAYRKKQARERLVFTDEVDAMLASNDEGRSSAQSDRVAHLKHCLQGMSSKNRELIEWRYQGERTMEKIAEDIGSTIGAVKVKLHRLRRQLLSCIQNRMQEDGT
jgi:RNA polymerase sigma-70 factor (ECF subfamily)